MRGACSSVTDFNLIYMMKNVAQRRVEKPPPVRLTKSVGMLTKISGQWRAWGALVQLPPGPQSLKTSR